jgi:hypothetical protein
MRRFFLRQGVRVQVVAGPLPHVIQPAQRAAQGVSGDALLRGDFHELLEQGDRPTGVRTTQILGGKGEEGLQQMLVVLVQRRVAPPPGLVPQRLGVMVPGVGIDPVVDALSRHPEQTSEVGGGAPLVVLQDG